MAHINKINYKKDFKSIKSDIIARGVFEDEKHWTISSGQMKGKVGDLAFSFDKDEKVLFFVLGNNPHKCILPKLTKGESCELQTLHRLIFL